LHNHRKVICIFLSFCCIITGVLTFIWLSGSGILDSFNSSYILSAVLELSIIGIPVFLLLYSGFDRWQSFLKTLLFPDILNVGLSLLTAVSLTMVSGLIGVTWHIFLKFIGYTAVDTALPNPISAIQWVIAIFTAAILPAVCEEMLFRGLALGLLKKRLSGNTAIFLSALLFAICHFNLVGFPSLLLIGIILAKVMVRHGMIWVPILIHAGYNASSIIINASGADIPFVMILLCIAVFFLSMYYLIHKEDASCS
jgi:membrane protease YdiL (CAAX protease family)